MVTVHKITSPSQHFNAEPATMAGFSFITKYGDNMGTNVKYANYKPAALYDKGKKWFVFYSYRNPDGRFQRFKVYEGINTIKDLREKTVFGNLLRRAVNNALANDFNPFTEPSLKVASRNWSLIQGLNYFKQNLENRGLRKRTIQSYQSVIRMLYTYLNNFLLEDIKTVTKQQVSSSLAYAFQKQKWSNSTFNNNLTFVRAIFNWLIDAEIIDQNPASKVKPLPENITRNKYFDDITFQRIKENAPGDLLEYLLFLYHTGVRPNEAIQLRYEHINRQDKLLFIPASISKNKKDDYVPLTDYVLTKYVNSEGLIFPFKTNYYSSRFTKLKEKLKLDPGHNLYSIKATRAVNLANDGASPYAIMALFRHSSLEITQKYLRGLGLTVNREAADLVRK